MNKYISYVQVCVNLLAMLHKYCRVDCVQHTIIRFKHYVSTHQWDHKHIYAASQRTI